MAEAGPTGLFAVLHASSVLEGRLEARLSEVGLSLAKLAALHRLTEAGESLPLGQLAERLSCVESNVTQLVDRLEADGLVTRTSDPNDRRSRLAILTPDWTQRSRAGGAAEARSPMTQPPPWNEMGRGRGPSGAAGGL